MARQDAKMETRYQHITPPRRKLEYLLNETYVKIDELKELLRKEAVLTGGNKNDLAVDRMFSRQDYLITLCAEACTESDTKNYPKAGPSGMQSGARSYVAQPAATTDQAQVTGTDKEYTKTESWYGSLDRSLAKKKKNQYMDKRRRHTKTIGSMAGLNVIKKSVELKPDEQYEIGLPAAPRVTSTRSSIFPMTQHQYYTALMESKLTKKLAYPLDVRQVPNSIHYHSASTSGLPSRQSNHWGYPVDGYDENKNMKKVETLQTPPHPSQHMKPPNLVPLPCRSLGSELAFRHSSKSSKKWYETNLDEAPPSSPHTPVTTQNSSPSPSMLSSARGSSRGSVASGMDTVDGAIARMTISSPANESAEFTSKSSESSESWSGTGHEVTKPFEMSDYYKYSTKFRSRNSPVSEETNHAESRISNGPSSASSTSGLHSRHASQPSIDATNNYRDTNGNPSVGPKLPPKQRRNQNKSISSSSIIFEADISNGDPAKDIWITNEPTFV